MGKKKYFAFISYQSNDVEWAKWLEHELDFYHLPSNLNPNEKTLHGERIRDNLRDVFWDSRLAAGGLNEGIKSKLECSANLIVICSPNSANVEEHPWVNEEIIYFIELGRLDHIFPFIVEGKKPKDFFPPALLNLPKDKERVGGNVNKDGKDAAFIKIVAGMLDVDVDILWQHYEKEKAKQEREEREKKEKLQIAQSRFIAEKANQLVEKGDSYTARLLALEALPKDLDNPDRPYVAEAEAALRNAANHNSAILRGHNSDVIDVVFSSNGDFLLSISKDETIRLWESKNGRCINTYNSYVEAISFLSDKNNRFVTAKPYCSRELQTWDFEETNHPIEEKRIRLHVINRLLCFSYDGRFLFAVRNDELKIWKTANGDLWKEIKKDEFSNVCSIAVSPNGKKLACGFKIGIIKVFDIEKEAFIITYKGHTSSIDCLSFGSQKEYLVSSSWSTAFLWDIPESDNNPICDKYVEILSEEKHLGKINSLSFNPDDEEIIVSRRNTVNIWYIKNRNSKILHGHMNDVNNARQSPKGDFIVTASSDKTIRLWDCHIIIDYKIIPFPSKMYAWKASFSFDCKLVAIIDEKVIYLWDINTGEYKAFEGHEDLVSSVEFSPDGKMLISTSRNDCTVRIWNVDTGDCRILDKTKELAEFAFFSSDDKYIVTASDNDNGTRKKLLKLWNVDWLWSDDNKPFRTFECENCIAMTSLVSSEEKVIALDMWGNYYEWDISQNNDAKCVSKKIYDGTIVEGMIEISPDGDMVCFIVNTSICLWDRKKSVLNEIKEAHKNQVQSIKFNSTGDLLVSTSIDKTIKIWNVASRICIKTFYGHTGEVMNAIFLKDDEHVISISRDNTIIQWDFLPLPKLIKDTYTRFKNRELTPEEKKKYYLE